MDFYIYAPGDFDPAKLAQIDTITPEVQAAARYAYPYARVRIADNMYCAFAKWNNWQRLTSAAVLRATCGTTPGLSAATCDYPKEPPPPSATSDVQRTQNVNAIRQYAECVCITLGMTESEVVNTSLERLIQITTYSKHSRMVSLSEFMRDYKESTEPAPFEPGDLKNFDDYCDAINAGR